MCRSGLQGPAASLIRAYSYAIPSILKFGRRPLQERFLPDLLLGKKRICIVVTEPEAGSDVATTATKREDSKQYIVNGTNKRIRNGIWSSHAIMAVRTSGPGPTGLSLLAVPLLYYPGVGQYASNQSRRTFDIRYHIHRA